MPRDSIALAATPFTLVDEAEEDVLGADVAVVEQACFFLCQHDHPTSPIGEAFKHGESVPVLRPAPRNVSSFARRRFAVT